MEHSLSARSTFYARAAAATRKPLLAASAPTQRRTQNLLAGNRKVRSACETALRMHYANTPLQVAETILAAHRERVVDDLVEHFGCRRTEMNARDMFSPTGAYARFASDYPEFWHLPATRIQLTHEAKIELNRRPSRNDDFALLLESFQTVARLFGIKNHKTLPNLGELAIMPRPAFVTLPERAMLLSGQIVYGYEQNMGLELCNELSPIDEIMTLAWDDSKPLALCDEECEEADGISEVDPYAVAVHDLDHWLSAAKLPRDLRQNIILFLKCFADADLPITRTQNFKESAGFYLDLPMKATIPSKLKPSYQSYYDYLLHYHFVGNLMYDNKDRRPTKKEICDLLEAARENARVYFASHPDLRKILRAFEDAITTYSQPQPLEDADDELEAQQQI